MNIQLLLQQCLQHPDISLRQDGDASTLILRNKKGTGSMQFLPLLPGITLAYIDISAEQWPAPDLLPVLEPQQSQPAPASRPPLLLNYCLSGRCELLLNDGTFVYLNGNDFSLSESFAQGSYYYPRRRYQGVEFFLDLETIQNENRFWEETLSLDPAQLSDRYETRSKTRIFQTPQPLQQLLRSLWDLQNAPGAKQKDGASSTVQTTFTQKLLTLQLLDLLLHQPELPRDLPRTCYTRTQVEIAKHTKEILSKDLKVHHPARELAALFSISETSLKNYFRGVYGQNLSEYMRDLRMEHASELLAHTRLSVSRIAEECGYLNQSKFAAVFRKQYSCTPLEYRRESSLPPTR